MLKTAVSRDRQTVTYPPDSTGDTTLTNGGSKGKLSWNKRREAKLLRNVFADDSLRQAYLEEVEVQESLTLKEKFSRMKPVPSFSLRIWRSLCKALSLSTLPKENPRGSESRLCTSSQLCSLPLNPRTTAPAQPGCHTGPQVLTQRAVTALAVSILLPVCRDDHHTLFACCQLKNKDCLAQGKGSTGVWRV